MNRARRFLAPVLIAALAAPPSARAQSSVAWTLCTPGGFSSCHSLELTTAAVFTGVVRTGTAITVDFKNLNGTDPNDNVAWSHLLNYSFTSNAPRTMTAGDGGYVNGTPENGSIGGPFVWFQSASEANGNSVIYGDWNSNRIGGCGTGPFLMESTCPPGSYVEVTSTTSAIFDATEFNALEISVMGGYTANDVNIAVCNSDPANSPGFETAPQCNVESQTFETTAVTPEPATMLLLATGLFGMGGVRLRRRTRRDG